MSHYFYVMRQDDEQETEGDHYKMSVDFIGVDGGHYEMIINNEDTPKQFTSALKQFANTIDQGIRHEWH